MVSGSDRILFGLFTAPTSVSQSSVSQSSSLIVASDEDESCSSGSVTAVLVVRILFSDKSLLVEAALSIGG